jgi:hypothetical protein
MLGTATIQAGPRRADKAYVASSERRSGPSKPFLWFAVLLIPAMLVGILALGAVGQVLAFLLLIVFLGWSVSRIFGIPLSSGGASARPTGVNGGSSVAAVPLSMPLRFAPSSAKMWSARNAIGSALLVAVVLPSLPGQLPLDMLPFGTAVVFTALWRAFRIRAVVTPEEVEVVNYWRHSHLRWAQVTEVTECRAWWAVGAGKLPALRSGSGTYVIEAAHGANAAPLIAALRSGAAANSIPCSL